MKSMRLWLGLAMTLAGIGVFGFAVVLQPASPDEHRAVALGMMVDHPAGASSIDTAIEVAERLRQKYGIDTGDPVADRAEAARRVQAEVLQPLSFDEAELRKTALELGYDPDDCANYCASLGRLAEVELRKRALLAFAESR